jgi:hypothetical protein
MLLVSPNNKELKKNAKCKLTDLRNREKIILYTSIERLI